MSVANKKRLSRVKGINWKKVILWTFNIVCYIITFIFTISLIIGSVKDSETSNPQSTNSAIDINAKQQYSLVVEDDTVILSGTEFYPRYYGTLTRDSGSGFYSVPSIIIISFIYDDVIYDDITLTLDDVSIEFANTISFNYYGTHDDFDSLSYFIYFYSSSIDDNIPSSFSYDGYFSFDSTLNDELLIIPISSIQFDNFSSSDVSNTLYWAVYDYYYGEPNYDIFETIGDTIPSFVSTLNSGLTEAVSIFYDDGLTTIGYLSAIVVAVVLGYFSLRAVLGLVRLRG